MSQREASFPFQPSWRKGAAPVLRSEAPVRPPDPLQSVAFTLRFALTLLVCLLCSFLIVMACTIRLDIYAVARARLEPVGLSKTIQSLTASRVRAVYVDNGVSVKKGALLVEFDLEDEEADRRALQTQIRTLDSEMLRRSAAIAWVRNARAVANWRFSSSTASTAGITDHDADLLAADIAYLCSSLDVVNEKIADDAATESNLAVAVKEQQQLIDLLSERVHMREVLLKGGLGPKISVIDAREALENAVSHLIELRGAWVKAGIAGHSAKLERENRINEFIAENTQLLASAAAKRAQVAESLAKALARVRESRILAPISGTVQELNVHTIGQVVTPAQKLMTLVPQNAVLEAQALIENRDIGVIKVGQRAVLKLESFPFTRYGTLEGTIVAVSRDAVMTPPPMLPDFATSTNSLAAADRTQQYMYPVTIALNLNSTPLRQNRMGRLLAGMNARVEIRIGERRPIDYLFSQVREVSAQALRER